MLDRAQIMYRVHNGIQKTWYNMLVPKFGLSALPFWRLFVSFFKGKDKLIKQGLILSILLVSKGCSHLSSFNSYISPLIDLIYNT